MPNCVFNFNILALVLFGILRVPNLHQGALRSPEAPQQKNFDMRACTCLYLYNCKFSASQLHSRGTNGALSLQQVCIEKICQNGVFGDFGGGAKIFGGNPPRNAMTADLRRLVKKKLWRCFKQPSLYTRQRNYKKRNVYAMRVTFHPCAALTPLNPYLPRGACWVLQSDHSIARQC